MDKDIKINKNCVELSVNSGIYSKETVFAAAYIFMDRCYILLDKEKGRIIVRLYPKVKKIDKRRIALDFYNELLNYSHYFSRAKANAEAIKLIMRRALFSAAPSLLDEAQDREIKKLIKDLEEEEKDEQKIPLSKRRK